MSFEIALALGMAAAPSPRRAPPRQSSLQNGAPVTVVKLVRTHFAIVADQAGVANLYDLRTAAVAHKLLEPQTYSSTERSQRPRWEAEVKGACPVVAAAVCDHASWTALLSDDSTCAVYDNTSWTKTATLNLADKFPTIRAGALAVTRLPASV